MTAVKLKQSINYNGKKTQLDSFFLGGWEAMPLRSYQTSFLHGKLILYVTLVYNIFLGWLLYAPYDVVSANPLLLFLQLCSSPFCFLEGRRHKSDFPDPCDFIILTLWDLELKSLTRETDKENFFDTFPWWVLEERLH